MQIIPHNRPCLDRSEIAAVTRVLKSGWLVMGNEVKLLEDEVRKLTGRKFAVAVNSGLSALHLSLITLGVGKGDEVIIPTYVCAALLHAVNYVGATPVLVDSEEAGFNLDPALVKGKITGKTKAIIAPHTFGYPADMKSLLSLGVSLIEDCAQAFGTICNGKPAGSWGEISVFSFYASKMVAAGQGGMVVTDNIKAYEIVNDLIHHDQRQDYKVRYNYQFTDLAAAIARVQLAKLNKFLNGRREIAAKYRIALAGKNLKVYPAAGDRQANSYRFVIEFGDEKFRDKIKEKLKQQGITAIVPIAGYQLLHRYLNLDKHKFPRADKLAATTLSLPVFPCLDEADVELVVNTLQDIAV